MTQDRHERLGELFMAAVKLDPDARAAFLDEACGDDPDLRAELIAMLRHDETAGEEDALAGAGAVILATELDRAGELEVGGLEPGQQVGPYRVERVLGEGGFAVVYAAIQEEPVRRPVAIKVLKPGMDSKQVLTRFEAERHALALMDHEHVARILDAGSLENGRPYFVMELVDGTPITDFARSRELGVDARLALFRQACRAVQHAHQKGVIHRDIKPSNVLVTDGDDGPVVKVIDFGVAKAISTPFAVETLFTEHGQLVGTPEYMSPEQADPGAIDVDTRADVYALGVMLFELLVGAPPFDLRGVALEEMRRTIREVDPPRPSTRLSTIGETSEAAPPSTSARRLRGDLDWIVLKAMEKDRGRRYESAAGLAEDVERFLADEPVQASPPSVAYVLRKFTRRHRAGVTAAALLLTALLIGIVGTTWGMVRALTEKTRADAAVLAEAHARGLAQSRAAELEQVSSFQSAQLRALDPRVVGARIRQDVLEEVDAMLDRTGVGTDEAAAHRDALERRIAGANFTNVAMRVLDESIFERTLTAIDDQFDDQPLVRARLLQSAATAMAGVGLLDAALPAQLDALEIRRAALGNDDPATIESIASLGDLHLDRGEFDEAERLMLEAVERSTSVFGQEDPRTLARRVDLGLLRQRLGRLDEAEQDLALGFAGLRRVAGPDDRRTISAQHALGVLRRDQGRLDEAETMQLDAVERMRRTLGPTDAATLAALGGLGSMYVEQSRFGDAETVLLEALEGSRVVLGDDHPSTLSALTNVGVILRNQGRYDEAAPYFEEALARMERVMGDRHMFTHVGRRNVGSNLRLQGRFVEAEPHLRLALQGLVEALGEEHVRSQYAASELGAVLSIQGRHEEALPFHRVVYQGRLAGPGADHPATLRAQASLGLALFHAGDTEAAEALYRDNLERSRRVFGEDHHDTLRTMSNLALLLHQSGRIDEAEPLTLDSLERRERTLGPDHPDVLSSVGLLAAIRRDQGRLDEAETLLRRESDRRAATLGPRHPRTLHAQRQLASTLIARRDWTAAESLALTIFETTSQESGGADAASQLTIADVLVPLHEARHADDPDAGHDRTAAEWRARLVAPPAEE